MKTTHPIIRILTEKITSELKPVDREAAFDAMLDESGPVNVAGVSLMPSDIWKNCDETAYRCGVNDFADGEAWVEIDGETYDQREVEEIVEAFKSDLESELSDLEQELEEELAAFSDMDDEESERILQEQQQEIDNLKANIADKQAEIDAIEADNFFN